MELNTVTRRVPEASRPRRRAKTRAIGGLYRVRRIALLAALLALIPAAFSYLSTMAEPSNSSFGIRTVEWLRDHGAAGLVARVESTYYELTAPSRGGPTLRALPSVGYGAGRSTLQGLAPGTRQSGPVTAYRPPRVAPLIRPGLPGEGVWHPTRPGFAADPPILLTTLRNQPEYPRVVAGLAWIDTTRTRLTLNPGRLEPSVSIPRGSMDVPEAGRDRLLATFNSGFKLSDSHGGFVLNGHTYATMQDGQATLVGYRDARSTWSTGATDQRLPARWHSPARICR